MNKFKDKINQGQKKLKKSRIEKNLIKQYNYTNDQITKIFSLWEDDLDGLKIKIKEVVGANNDLCIYTDMGNEIGKTLYDELVKKKALNDTKTSKDQKVNKK